MRCGSAPWTPSYCCHCSRSRKISICHVCHRFRGFSLPICHILSLFFWCHLVHWSILSQRFNIHRDHALEVVVPFKHTGWLTMATRSQVVYSYDAKSGYIAYEVMLTLRQKKLPRGRDFMRESNLPAPRRVCQRRSQDAADSCCMWTSFAFRVACVFFVFRSAYPQWELFCHRFSIFSVLCRDLPISNMFVCRKGLNSFILWK